MLTMDPGSPHLPLPIRTVLGGTLFTSPSIAVDEEQRDNPEPYPERTAISRHPGPDHSDNGSFIGEDVEYEEDGSLWLQSPSPTSDARTGTPLYALEMSPSEMHSQSSGSSPRLIRIPATNFLDARFALMPVHVKSAGERSFTGESSSFSFLWEDNRGEPFTRVLPALGTSEPAKEPLPRRFLNGVPAFYQNVLI
ncbi:uncharacterized protein EI90DRAFT_3115501 [Cantharellus anzutake]|uniref:uncharacterized protein n=1 Tax=Cantharellus anzutake TaxID=1750568 RepID=UPI0019060718|nr:uncharacterized protein EI90DRAFT_3115501 [Cantharellus anzutake]KAF8343006.1 hypothetical protein EI90DRAFT_3115501 [Cantharellus anzutake]